ncbi:unnamed protein product [Cylicocyclus nassatus]|uniref:Biopterin-dependent aromatic amino acid hydroxylase family profile domain-containing protein n=1 Tax=Cylicocyclus nassatus TaxID=53992 RepID=A0AA36MEU4_CYLNA|nr:unnamed protein product [Cylicocyclus nassatus]
MHAGLRRRNTTKFREQLVEVTKGEQIFQQLNDEGVELIWAADKGSIGFTAVLSSSSELAPFVREVIQAFTSNDIRISHVETRQHKLEKGHGDATYIARRNFLNDHAMQYKHGDPIPIVEYTEQEHAT